ncbi:unnamed protein product [Arabidopsis lyrata]|nr:unnamed protein product [Arabidopsis lyrata]
MQSGARYKYEVHTWNSYFWGDDLNVLLDQPKRFDFSINSRINIEVLVCCRLKLNIVGVGSRTRGSGPTKDCHVVGLTAHKG